MQEVGKKHATAPLVLALDVGSSGTRGRLVDAEARPLKKLEARARHAHLSKSDGTVVADAEETLSEIVQIIDRLVEDAGRRAGDIGAVACDTFASSLVGVDGAGKPLTPVYTYADSRSAGSVAQLRQMFDEGAVQHRTGCRFHASYVPARFLWLADTEPDIARAVVHWLSLGEFVYLHLLGQRAASFSTAAWSGLLNRLTLAWDEELIDGLPVTVDQLAPLHDSTEPLQGLTPPYARRWPQLQTARWFPAIADGYASNLGSDAVDEATYALSLGTSGAVRVLLNASPVTVPPGLWCYQVNRRQSLLGGALNDGGRALAWIRGLLDLPDPDALAAVVAAPPADTTPVVLPFLTGERSPGWAAHATASFSNMDLHTSPGDLYRGLLEGIGLRLGLIVEELRTQAPAGRRIVTSGGAAEDNPGWLQILADIIQLPIVQSLEGQNTLRGTALMALEVIAPDTRRVPADEGFTATPAETHADAYRRAAQRQASAYDRLVNGR